LLENEGVQAIWEERLREKNLEDPISKKKPSIGGPL
jgi:hypothetical protein